jgi:hypothetical protein
MGISHGCTVFIGSKAAEAAAAAAETAAKEAAAKVERAMAEMKLKTEREAAAAAQKRRDAEAIAAASFELSAMFDKALSHLGVNAPLGGGAAAAVANRVENVVELHETLLDLCSKAEVLTARVPQIKSVAKIVEPCLMRLLEAINKNRESGELLWLDDATPRTRQSFNRCRLRCLLTLRSPLSLTLSYVCQQYSKRVGAACDRSLRGAVARQHIEEMDSSAHVYR